MRVDRRRARRPGPQAAARSPAPTSSRRSIRSTRRPITGASRTCRSTLRRGAGLHSGRAEDRTAALLLEQRQARAGRKAAVGAERRAISPSCKRRARRNGVVCYTAYNHRFEPHFVRMRDLIASGELGAHLSLPHVLRQRHGAAGARFGVARPGAGVLPDLGSHLLDTVPLLVRRHRRRFPHRVSASRFENRAPDHVVIASTAARAAHRARDDAADVAQPFHLRHPRRERHRAYRVAVQMGTDRRSRHRTRVLPSGRPPEETRHAGPGRSDLGARIRAFQDSSATRARQTDLSQRSLAPSRRCAARRRAAMRARRMSQPTVGFAGMTHLGLVSATALRAARAFDARLRSRRRA